MAQPCAGYAKDHLQGLAFGEDSSPNFRSLLLHSYCKTRVDGASLWGAVVENPPANAGDMGSSPGPGRSHMPRSN